MNRIGVIIDIKYIRVIVEVEEKVEIESGQYDLG